MRTCRLVPASVLALLLTAPACAPVEEGRFTLQYDPAQSSALQRWQQIFQREQALAVGVAALNSEIGLPAPVLVRTTECGEPNAFYVPAERQIAMCYELAARIAELFQDDAENEEDLIDLVIAGMEFVFHHEVGHALVDVLDLPITGREEDAVDDLATLLYIHSGEAGIALVGATQFFDEGIEELDTLEDVEDLSFWGEHSLSLQRYYAIVCLVVGSDPAAHADVRADVPELESRDCVAEYEQKARAWDRLLAPYLK